MRVYNREGRRDNKYKARIKILVKETGIEAFKEKVFAEWEYLKDGPQTLTEAEIDRCKAYFIDPDYAELTDTPDVLHSELQKNILFASWHSQNVHPHKKAGYSIVTLCFKETGVAPGDFTR